MWQTINAALEVLWDPEGQNAQDESSNGLATAQMILTAAEISLPTGDLANGVYDSLGNYYQIPEWVVCDPQNVIEDVEDVRKGEASTAGEDTAAEDEGLSENDHEGKEQEKGKEVVDVREKVPLRARLSENGKDVKISIIETESVRHVCRKIAEKAGVRMNECTEGTFSLGLPDGIFPIDVLSANLIYIASTNKANSDCIHGQAVEGRFISGCPGVADRPYRQCFRVRCMRVRTQIGHLALSAQIILDLILT